MRPKRCGSTVTRRGRAPRRTPQTPRKKSREAVDSAGRDARKGWEEVTDAVKAQE